MSYSNSFDVHRRRPRTFPQPRRTYAAPRQTYTAPYPPRRRQTSPAQFGMLAVLVVGLALACWFAATSLTSLTGGAQAAEAQAGQPQSDPRSSWAKGTVPALYQGDPTWAQESYAEAAFSETGCGPTCMAMVYVALTGRDDKSPADMGALSEQMGCASSDGTAWLFMTEGATDLGLVAREVPADEASVRQAILSGSPVVCSMRPGDFTTTGHFIVLAGIDEQGRLTVRDPNSPERTARAWDFDTVLGQCRALWAYSAA